MKYHRLTHEQLSELHYEFAVFLTTQGLDQKKWQEIKKKEPERVDQFLDLFSDLVWDRYIRDCEFLEYSATNQLFLFKITPEKAYTYILKTTNTTIDFTVPTDVHKVFQNLAADPLHILEGSKAYDTDALDFIYEYLKKGAVKTEGAYFKALESYFSNSSK